MKTKTKAQLRIEIAKDVLKHIKANRITVETGDYFEPKVRGNAIYKGKQLKEVLPKLKECRVCALGGLFYSYVSKYNNFQIDVNGIGWTDFYGGEMRELMGMFSKHQLYLIECAFERDDIQENCLRSGKFKILTTELAINYRYRNGIENDEEALIHIMKNIIRNKGTFKP